MTDRHMTRTLISNIGECFTGDITDQSACFLPHNGSRRTDKSLLSLDCNFERRIRRRGLHAALSGKHTSGRGRAGRSRVDGGDRGGGVRAGLRRFRRSGAGRGHPKPGFENETGRLRFDFPVQPGKSPVNRRMSEAGGRADMFQPWLPRPGVAETVEKVGSGKFPRVFCRTTVRGGLISHCYH